MSDSEFDAQSRARELVNQFRRNTNNFITDKNFEDLANSIAQALNEKPTFNIIENNDVEDRIFIDTSALESAPQGWPSEEEAEAAKESHKHITGLGWMNCYRWLTSQFARPAPATITEAPRAKPSEAEIDALRQVEAAAREIQHKARQGRLLRQAIPMSFELVALWDALEDLDKLRGGT